MKINKFGFVILIIVLMLILSGCSLNNNQSDSIKEKVSSELSFYETKILSMINHLSNVSEDNYDIVTSEQEISEESAKSSSAKEEGNNKSSNSTTSGEENSNNGSNNTEKTQITEYKSKTILNSEDKINWDDLKEEVELLNSSWNISINDLYSLNVPNDEILKFSNNLNECTLSIRNEDKIKSEENLVNLFGNIIKFLEYTDKNQNLLKIKQTEELILKSLFNMENSKWEESKSNLQSAISKIEEVIKDYNYMNENGNKVNRVYIGLNELFLSTDNKDRDLFLIKYRNLILELKNFT